MTRAGRLDHHGALEAGWIEQRIVEWRPGARSRVLALTALRGHHRVAYREALGCG
jgi:hypothetical protein